MSSTEGHFPKRSQKHAQHHSQEKNTNQNYDQRPCQIYWNTNTTKTGEDTGHKELSPTANGNAREHSHFEKHFSSFSKLTSPIKCSIHFPPGCLSKRNESLCLYEDSHLKVQNQKFKQFKCVTTELKNFHRSIQYYLATKK